ncbi:phage tail protein [Sutcliffiella horikoshii]|uniref:phage tail protein n=1 Tax=Sutcliffiella horikoshii TaxID=79883 RepID=UPI002041B98D|nr:phage tail protein [Sutcliffiella horikoshii]MCM3616668.1 phage tail protein [Sutcliffiella horikoshii]
MLAFTNLHNETEIVTNITSFKRTRKLNGERVIQFKVLPDESNKHSYHLIDNESTFKFGGDPYIIKQVNNKSAGNKGYKEVVASHTFTDHMKKRVQHKIHNGSITFNAVLQFIFEETDYNYVILDSFTAERFENFGRQSCLSLLIKVLERTGAEHYVIGKTVYFKKKIGQQTDFQYRYGVNIKAISVYRGSENLATKIKGYGGTPDDNGIYPIREEYISPNVPLFGELEQIPVINENLSTVAGMQERLKRELIDEPQLSITIDVVELRAAGYNQGQINEGDSGHIIYEPLDDLKMEARIVEIVEEYDGNFRPIKSNVTLSNIRNKASDMLTRFKNTSNTLDRLLQGQERVPYNALEEKVRRSTEMLLNSATELEYTNNGIIARSKSNPNHLVLVSSEGVGVSTDNGQSFRQAITSEGIVADLIVVGTMLFDRLNGGTLTLGGLNNGNGRMQVLNENGDVNADIDGNNAAYERLYAGDFRSPIVPNYNDKNYTIYIDISGGSDENEGTSSTNAYKSIQHAINQISKVNDGNINLEVYGSGSSTIVERINISGFVGRGTIFIDFRLSSRLFNGRINIRGNTNHIEIDGKYSKFSGSNQNEIINIERCTYVTIRQCRFYGNNSTLRGIRVADNSAALIRDNHFYDMTDGVLLETISRINGNNNVGNVSQYGYSAYGTSQIGHFANRPTGGVADIWTSQTSQQIGQSVDSTPPPKEAPPPPDTTNEWNTTGSPRGDAWRPQFGGQWWGDGSVVQGGWAGFGAYKGLWLFGNAPSNAVTGKIIKSIRIFVTRKSSGGNSGAVSCTFRPHTYTSRPNGEPSYQSPTTTANFKWGEGKWITLPSSFYAGFQNGTTKGIGIYVNSTSNGSYAKFNVEATLEITYA